MEFNKYDTSPSYFLGAPGTFGQTGVKVTVPTSIPGVGGTVVDVNRTTGEGVPATVAAGQLSMSLPLIILLVVVVIIVLRR